MEKLRTSTKKQIRIMYNKSLLPSFTAKILPSFRKKNPEISVHMLDGNSFIARDYLTNGMIDLAIIAVREPFHSILEYIPLYREELVLAVPSDHPCVESFQKSGVDFRFFTAEPFILNQADSYMRSLEREILSHYSFTPQIVHEISDFSASRHMVSNHNGIAFLRMLQQLLTFLQQIHVHAVVGHEQIHLLFPGPEEGLHAEDKLPKRNSQPVGT